MSINPSVAIQIEDAIAEALEATGSPCGVDRAATIEYDHENMPAYNVAEVKTDNDFTHEATEDSLAVESEFEVYCYAAGIGATRARAAVDPLLVFAHRQLNDETFGGLAREVEVAGYRLNYDRKGSIEIIEAVISLKVKFDVMRGDPSQNYNV